MKKIIAMVLALTMVLALAACGSKTETPAATAAAEAATEAAPAAPATDLETIKANGKMVVGITDYAPMDYLDDNGEWTGFDAEFARAVAEKLGVACEFIEIDWDNKYFELNAKTIDCIWNGMTITEEGKLNASISNPYVKNAQVVVMKADAAANYTSVESLADLTFAVEAGSAGAEALEELGLTNVVEKSTQTDAVLEVSAGSCDACVIDLTMANAMTGAGTSYADLTSAMELTSEEYGIAFRTGSDTCDEVNKLMAAMMTDGTLDALAAKYELVLVK